MRHKGKWAMSIAMLLGVVGVYMMYDARFSAEATRASCAVNTQADLTKALAIQKPVFLLDVREPEEFAAQSLKDAVNIPLAQVEDHLAEIPKDKSILVLCRSGRRSAAAAEILRQHGYSDVKSLEGGMMKWNAELSHLKGCV